MKGIIGFIGSLFFALLATPAGAIYVYPNVRHAFCRYVDPKDIHEKEQASKANERTWEFLKRLSSGLSFGATRRAVTGNP